MARKQVLVQLDDDLIAKLDKVARETGLSRSELIRRAANALVEARRIRRAEYKLVEAYRRLPQDPTFVESAERLAAQTAPDW